MKMKVKSTKPNQTTYSLAKKKFVKRQGGARAHVPTCPLAGDATD